MAHQGDRRGFNGDIAPAAHRNAYVSLRQRRGVVDAVAHHRHLATLTLQVLDGVRFAVRQHARDHLINTGFFRNGVGGGRVVPGQHHQTIARAVQAL